ncbi:hypothetical protein NX059_001618 [Plenodomus lindquistii]|nr:hypothetical protein NX059_001618 [Plenodomus lindquistii]
MPHHPYDSPIPCLPSLSTFFAIFSFRHPPPSSNPFQAPPYPTTTEEYTQESPIDTFQAACEHAAEVQARRQYELRQEREREFIAQREEERVRVLKSFGRFGEERDRVVGGGEEARGSGTTRRIGEGRWVNPPVAPRETIGAPVRDVSPAGFLSASMVGGTATISAVGMTAYGSSSAVSRKVGVERTAMTGASSTTAAAMTSVTSPTPFSIPPVLAAPTSPLLSTPALNTLTGPGGISPLEVADGNAKPMYEDERGGRRFSWEDGVEGVDGGWL